MKHKPIFFDAEAHCDIPCGIYDPFFAVSAAQTVLKMTNLLEAHEAPSGATPAAFKTAVNSMVRYITSKEEHAQMVKDQLLILWTDYFKPMHLNAHPDLHTKVWDACKLASQCKQTVDVKAAQDLQMKVKEVADIFWATKQ